MVRLRELFAYRETTFDECQDRRFNCWPKILTVVSKHDCNLPIECPGNLFSVGVCGLFKHAQHANARAFGRHESLADRRVVGTVHTIGAFCRVSQRKSGLGNRGRRTTHSRAFRFLAAPNTYWLPAMS